MDIKTITPAALKPLPAKTTGEKWFDAIRFTTGETIILGLTAVLAYVSKYGKDSYGKMPNFLKRMDEGIKTNLERTALLKNSDNGTRIAESVATTTTLMHGGNLFVPVMKGLQDRKQDIVDTINEHWGKPGEVKAGKERLESQEKENWGDIIKGRLGSWAIVFTSLLSADLVIGKKQGTQEYWSDRFKDKFGRIVAGFTKEGREIAKTPLSQSLTDAQRAYKPYRFGKILALDIFATTAAVSLWAIISKFSAMGREKKVLHGTKLELIPDASNDAASKMHSQNIFGEQGTIKEHSVAHAPRMGERPANYRALAETEASDRTAYLS